MKLRKILFSTFALFALSLTTITAQPGGGMGGQGGGQGRERMGGEQQQQSYKILEQAGYFELDSEDIIKKLKLKKDEAKKSDIRKVVISYTKGYEAVGQKYSKEIAAIDKVQKQLDNSEGDMASKRKLMQSSRANLSKIRVEMVALHKQLSEVDMPAILDEKQAALWKRYYSMQCRAKGFRLNMPQQRKGGQGGGQRQRPQM